MVFYLRTPGDVGAAIRTRRRALGLDQAELAERIGVSRLWVNQVERGKPGASLGLVLRAFATLDVALTGREREQDADMGPTGTQTPSDHPATLEPDINAIVDRLRKRPMP